MFKQTVTTTTSTVTTTFTTTVTTTTPFDQEKMDAAYAATAAAAAQLAAEEFERLMQDNNSWDVNVTRCTCTVATYEYTIVARKRKKSSVRLGTGGMDVDDSWG